MKEKPPEVKIIQIISHCPNTTGGDYAAYYSIYGLGDDGLIYKHNDYSNTWTDESPSKSIT